MGASIEHIALIVRDPARTAALFAGVLGARVVFDHLDRDNRPQTCVKFCGVWFVLRQGDGPLQRNGDRIALTVSPEVLHKCLGTLATFDVEHYVARGNTALYFMDYDNHVFELDASGLSLDEELGSPVKLPRARSHALSSSR